MKKVLVTGANGLLGTNTVLELLEQGFYVKALIRNINNFIDCSHINLELVVGDITEYSSIEPFVKDCDYIVHTAANTSQNLLKVSDYDKANIKGTKNIIDICKNYKIQRLIYIGTANTFGYGSLEDLGNEEKPIRKPFTKSFYALSKLKAQKLIDNSSSEIDVVTVSPTFMIGAYDAKPSSGKIILMSIKKNVLFYPPGGKNFIHVKDVSKGVVNVLKNGENGETYLLSNENISYKNFFKIVTKKTNGNPVMIKLPKFILYVTGIIGEILRFFCIKTAISLTNMKILMVNNYYSNQKVIDKFKTEFLSTEKAVEDAVKWFKKERMF